ncbi:MAG TPA: hypothetical protein PKD70_06270 [Saprospiraceae bacterium]|nr:hypothetical protein [Saprospiraceae bacterium]HMP13463.1 hypothetical protein [Saprospiraceae bacterium]
MNQITIAPSALTLSGVTVEITPPDAGTATVTQIETTGAFSIPAGQRFVDIYIAGAVQPGDLETNATIQGQSLSVGNRYQYEQTLDAVNNILELSPAITGDGNGGRLFIKFWS